MGREETEAALRALDRRLNQVRATMRTGARRTTLADGGRS